MNRLAVIALCLLASIAQARNPRGTVISGSPFIGSCPVTSGPITVVATTPRSTGISPLLVFFDATGTTYSGTLQGANNPFQDLSYAWTFGDGGASGTSTWAYGSNPGVNSRNTATGAIAAHLYVTSGADQPYTATVTASDGTNTASCTVSGTAYDPSGSNGFVGSATTCVAQSTLPVAGSGGCPAGAGVLTQSNYNTALTSKFGSSKRVLFKCGDTFTGTDTSLSAVKWSIGAYGSCVGTQTGRPIFNTSSVSAGALVVSLTSGDGRIADIDCEGAGTGGGCVNWVGGNVHISYQIAMWNLASSGNSAAFDYSQCAQCGMIGTTQIATPGSNSISDYINFNQNNPATWSGNTINNLDYQAFLGNSVTGGNGSGNVEAFRMGGGRFGVISNNSFTKSNSGGSLMKFHNGNTNGTVATWTGIYTEYWEISDNFYQSPNGGWMAEMSPENGITDERIRYIVFERNVMNGFGEADGGIQVFMDGQNMTARNNAMYIPFQNSPRLDILYGIQAVNRGSLNASNYPAKNIEIFNNTCDSTTTAQGGGQACIAFANGGQVGPGAINSFAQNNLFFAPSNEAVVLDTTSGSTNTVDHNTGTATSNPGFTNGSGTFTVLSDFRPTANYTGGTSVPSLYDGLGIAWGGTWDLGAVKH